jgi:3-deoxy-7-phosphoheptulonate synthase
MKKFEQLRLEIDKTDDEIISLLNKRFNLSNEIIKEKLKNSININDIDRENNIIDKAQYNDNYSKIKRIYRNIFKEAKFSHLSDTNLNDILKFRPIIIAGPCTVESYEQTDGIAKKLSSFGIKLLRGGAFKPRTNPNDFQGLGAKGVDILNEVAHKYQMYSVTELLDEIQLKKHIDDIDILQIGSRNMANYAFLKEVGRMTAKSKKPIILKRGFSATINEFINAAKYIEMEGNDNIILALRGIRTFEQIDSSFRNTPDLASILELKERTEYPVIFDPSHSAGNSKYVVDISLAALELGADGLIIETHNEPEKAIVDGFQSIKPEDLKKIFNFL